MKTLTIIKVGGKIVESADSLEHLMDDFSRIEGLKILVHGGGRSATALAERLGIPTVMIEGRRVTDSEMLKVVTMVYGGLVNKQIVASLQSRGINAVGLTGADMDIIRSHRRPATTKADYGFVGDVDRVDGNALAALLDRGFVPVIAPLSHDGHGSMLNTNADTIASEVAMAMAAVCGPDDKPAYEVTLTFCFEKPGVLADADNDSSVIPVITSDSFARLKADGTVQGGMLPKLENALRAISRGVSSVIITRSDAIANPDAGTRITA